MIKLFVFDMGGVICHDDDSIIRKMNEFLSNPLDTPYMSLFPNFPFYFNSYESGLISEEEVWKGYEKETGKKMKAYGPSLFCKFFNPTLHLPTVEVIKELKKKGKRVVAGTNVLPSHYVYHQEHGQYDFFDKVYASHLMHIRKPSIDFFKTILDEEELKGSEVFFTDDREINIDAAKEAGINAYLYKDELKLRSDLVALGALD